MKLKNIHRIKRRFHAVFFVAAFAAIFSVLQILLFVAPMARASIPSTFGYQGRLKNTAGTAQTGTFSFTFRMYASTTGGAALWIETQPTVSVDQAAFAVQLGSVTSFPTSLDFNQPIFLTTEVSGDGEMTPRIPINSVAYAMTAGGANALSATPTSATGGRMYYDTTNGSLNYFDGAASTWRPLAFASGTNATLNATNLTWTNATGTNTTSTNLFARNGITLTQTVTTLTATGTSALQTFTFTNGTGTSVTTTNLFATSGGFTNLTGGTFNPTNLTWTSATGTNVTTTNLGVTGFVGTSLTPSLDATLALGSSALRWNANFVNVTSTSVTTTNLFVTTGQLTNGTVTNLTFTNGTSTSWLGFATASGTTVNATGATLNTLTSQSVALSGGTINGTSIGLTTPAAAIFTNVTSTSVTTTNLFATRGVILTETVTNLTVTGTTSLQGLTFTNGTGTSVTTTNLSVVNGSLSVSTTNSYVSTTNPLAANSNLFTIASNGPTVNTANGLRVNFNQGQANSTIGTAIKVDFTTSAFVTAFQRGIEIGSLVGTATSTSASAIKIGANWNTGIDFISFTPQDFFNNIVIADNSNFRLTDESNNLLLSITDTGVSGRVGVGMNGTATTNGLCHSGANLDTATDVQRDIVPCSGAPGDYAEWYETATSVAVGDVVAVTDKLLTFDTSRVNPFTGQFLAAKQLNAKVAILKKGRASDGDNIVGVISTSPNQTIGTDIRRKGKNPLPLALVGRVPVKISDENGTIGPGDYLAAASTTGFAMKATTPGRVIGIALEPWTTGKGRIRMMVHHLWWPGNVIASDGSVTTSRATIGRLTWTNATGTNTTTTNLGILGFVDTNITPSLDATLALGSSALRWNAHFFNVTSTNATTTNFFATTLTWTNASGTNTLSTNVTTTSLFVSSSLNVSASNANVTSTFILNSASNTVPVLQVTGGCDNRSATGTGKLIQAGNTNDNATFNVLCNGNVFADGTFTSPATDFAEYFPSDGSMGVEEVSVLRFSTSTRHVTRGSAADRNRVLGVYSTKPSFLGGSVNLGASELRVPIALLGQVPTKVSAISASIAAGDELMAGDGGVAVKARGPGMVLGQALESLASGTGTIPVFVAPHWWVGDLFAASSSGNLMIADVRAVSSLTATAATPTVDSPLFSFQGSAWDATSSRVVTSIFTLKNRIISATSSAFTIQHSNGDRLFALSNDGNASIVGDLTIGRRLFLGSKKTGTSSFATYLFVDDTLGSTSTYIATNADGWQTSSTYDYAERYESVEDLIPGDIVTADPSKTNFVKRATSLNEQILGIVSTRPGFVTGGSVKGSYPVALAGRVPTRVSTGNGAIKIGDALMAS
ncbi:MAG: hypothetical protein AAB879_00815, partial [Patescibacteria group bacterium]